MSYQIRKLGLSYNAEVFVSTANQSRFNFSDNILMMDRVLIHAVFMPTVTVKTPSFKDVMPIGLARSGYLTLMSDDNHLYNSELPMQLLQKRNYFYDALPEGNEILFIKPKLVNLRNSYVIFSAINAYVIPAAGYALPFTFFYEKYNPAIHQLNDWGELIETK